MIPPEHSHEPSDIAARLEAGPRISYLKDVIYGGIDGAVTTFAVVSGVAGAGLATEIVIILGMANLVGDGFSMAAGNYLGTRAEAEEREKALRMEERHVREHPEGEREEIRQIFARKGFEGDELEDVVRTITANRRLWIETMLTEELGLPPMVRSPWTAAIATFIAFVLVGLVPLLPFVLALAAGRPAEGGAYAWSAGLTGIAFFAVGAAKSRFVERSWLASGLHALLIGGAAAALAYGVGAALGHLA